MAQGPDSPAPEPREGKSDPLGSPSVLAAEPPPDRQQPQSLDDAFEEPRAGTAPTSVEEALRETLARLGEYTLEALAWIYLWFWVQRAVWTHRITRGAREILALYLVFLLAEIVLELAGLQMYFSRSPVINLAFYLFFAIVLYSHVRDWLDRSRQFYFVEASGEIAAYLARRKSPGPDNTVPKFLALFKGTWGDDVVATVAQRDAEGALRVTQTFPPDSPHDTNLALGPHCGGAGYACANSCIVYFPWTRARHAIVQDLGSDGRFGFMPRQFVPDDVEDFKSVLSVPMLSDGHCFGVLNFHSRTRNPFRRFDFLQAAFYGLALAQILRTQGATAHTHRA